MSDGGASDATPRAAERPTPNDEGRQLVGGRFEIRGHIAAGSEGQVVLARDLDLGLDVVLKAQPYRDGPHLDLLRREASMLMRVAAHRGLPVVRSDLVEDGQYYMISDHISGRDLHDLVAMQPGGLGLAEVLDLIDQIADTLEHLHGHQPAVVHGDLKPENVVVTTDGRAVLLDFGASMWLDVERDRAGTPGFSAPEVLAGEPVSATADAYSLAALSVYLLTGIAPKFGTAWPEAIAESHLARLERVIRRGMTWDPLSRPRSARDFARSLRDAAEMDLPTGTITLLLLSSDDSGRTPAHNDAGPMAERAGGQEAGAARLPIGASLYAFSRVSDAAAAAFDISENTALAVTLHAGDLGGSHGATLQHLVDETIDVGARTIDAPIVCSPPVQMMLGTNPGLVFRSLDQTRIELTRAIAESSERDEPTDVDSSHVSTWIAARRTTPLAEREQSLHAAARAIDTSRAAAHAALLLVTGEAGIGKTRFLAELADRATESGELVFVGRCSESGGAFEVFLDAFGNDLFPFEAGLLERDEEGWIDRRRFFGRIATSLQETGRSLTLVLDDVQWIDGSSLALLTQLLDDVGPALAVLAGCRPQPQSALDELRRRPGGAEIRLEPLTTGGLAQLAAGLGVEIADDALNGMHSLTKGSPFFGLQLLSQFDGDSALSLDDGDLPTGVREWILDRVERLGADTAQALTAAAVIDRDFDVIVLADLIDASAMETLSRLDSALSSGLLVEGARPGEFRFVHAIVRASIADTLTATRRGLMHAAIARRLEEEGSDPEHREAALHHWFAADRLGDPLHAGEIAAEVGTRSIERLAHERAVSILDQALDIVDRATPSTERDRVEAQLRVARGRADIVATRNAEARAQLVRAADLAEGAGDGETLAQAALVASLNRRHGLDDPELLDLLERASDSCPTEPAVLPAMLHVRRSRLLPVSVDHADRSAIARRGLENLDGMDAVDRAMVETEVARACWSPDDAAERDATTSRIIERAEREVERGGPSRWTGVLIEALNVRWATRVQLGDLRGGLADAEHAARVADDAGTTFLLSRSMMGQAMIRATIGDHDAAEALSDESIRISNRHNLELVRLTIAYSIARDRGQQVALASVEQQFNEMVDSNPLFIAAFALVNAEAGHHDDGRRLLADLERLEPWPRNWLWMATAVAGLESAVLVGDSAMAERYAGFLQPFERQWAIAAAELGCWGPVDRVLGLAAHLAGDVDTARSLLIRARDASTANGADFWSARCHAGLAELSEQATDTD